MITGTCLCRAVRYEIDGPLSFMGHGHCSVCRKACGSIFVAWAAAPLAGFRWIRGEDRAASFKVPDAELFTQVFCRHCGGKGPRLLPEHDSVVLPAGSMDGPPGRAVDAHIYVASKAPWDQIIDGMPKFEERPTRR